MDKTHNALSLCLLDEVLREISKKDTTAKLWLKLESIYITKLLTNRLYLYKQLYTLLMQEVKPIKSTLMTLIESH